MGALALIRALRNLRLVSPSGLASSNKCLTSSNKDATRSKNFYFFSFRRMVGRLRCRSSTVDEDEASQPVDGSFFFPKESKEDNISDVHPLCISCHISSSPLPHAQIRVLLVTIGS